MPISGLVIECEPGARDDVIAALQAVSGLELTPTSADTPLVAVLEAPSIKAEEEIFRQIGELPGVRRVSLSYHNFEDLTDSGPNA